MKKFEYKIINDHFNHVELADFLNEQGRDGWELVNQDRAAQSMVTTGSMKFEYNFTFKRAVTPGVAKQVLPTLDEIKKAATETVVDVKDVAVSAFKWFTNQVNVKKN